MKRLKIFMRILAIIGLLSLSLCILSPIIWIWWGWSLFWKISLTSLVITGMIRMFTKEIESAIKDIEKKKIKK